MFGKAAVLTAIALFASTNAFAHDLKESEKSLIRSTWQTRINQHSQRDPQLAEVETQMMNAQLRADSPALQKLMPMYMEMQAQRNPSVAPIIRRNIAMYQQVEVLKAAIGEDFKAGRVSAAEAKKRQLIDLARSAAAM